MSDPLGLARPASGISTSEPVVARSFEEFFEEEKAGLYGALCLVTRNRFEAEELTQDAFVRVLERWERVAPSRTRSAISTAPR